MKELKILALLELLRLMHPNDDNILRIASSVVAVAFGYKSRSEWTKKIQELDLIDYRADEFGTHEDAKERYKALFYEFLEAGK